MAETAISRIKSVSSAIYNVDEDTDETLLLACPSAGMTLHLPSAVPLSGRVLRFSYTSGTGTATLSPSGSQTISGASSVTLTAVGDSATIISDGANWHHLRNPNSGPFSATGDFTVQSDSDASGGGRIILKSATVPVLRIDGPTETAVAGGGGLSFPQTTGGPVYGTGVGGIAYRSTGESIDPAWVIRGEGYIIEVHSGATANWALIIDANRKVGIGINTGDTSTVPQGRLHIRDAAVTHIVCERFATGTDYGKLDYGITNASAWTMQATSGGGLNLLGNLTFGDGKNIVAGTTTGTKIGTAGAQKLGFFGAAPIIEPTVTGSKGANAALTSLCTALANLGLIIDSTT